MSEKNLQIATVVFYIIEILVLWGIVIWAGIYNGKRMKKLCGNKEKEEFFFGKMGNNNRLKHKRNIMDGISSVCMLMMLLVVLFPICLIIANPNHGLRALWQGTGKFVDDLPAEMFAGLSIIAIITALAGVKKKTWFGFDIYDILREFSVVRKIGICLGLTFVCKILIFVAPVMLNLFGYEMYFAVRTLVLFGFFAYLFYLVKIMRIVIEILFGNNIDRFCADNMYRFLRLRRGTKREYGIEELTDATEYLVDEYVKQMRKIGCKKLAAISFDTNINPNGERLKKKKVWSSIVIAGIVTILTFIMTWASYPEMSEWCFQWGVVAFPLVLFVGLGVANNGFGGLFVTMCYGWVSYMFEYEKREVYSRETSLFEKRKYCKCVRSVENILALYSCLLEEKGNATEENVEKYVLKERADREGVEQDCMGMLLISMDYMHYRKTGRVINKFTFHRDDKCIQWAKGFAIKATNSVVGDRVDEEKFNEYIELKKGNKGKKKA